MDQVTATVIEVALIVLVIGVGIIGWLTKRAFDRLLATLDGHSEHIACIKRVIDRELRPNSGESIKDQVVKLTVQMDGFIDMHKDGGNHPRTKEGA